MIHPGEPQVISLAALRRALSARRLETFRTYPDEAPQVMLGRYQWNIALCAALYPALHYLEVALRNKLHLALTAPKLLELYGHIVQTIAWLEPQVPQLLPVGDDFREICGRGPSAYAVHTVQ